MNSKGITLIEIIVVVAIIAILAVALGFSYFGWQGSYKVESTTKQIYADLMTAREMALTRNRFYFADFPTATTYRISMDDSSGGAAKTDGDCVFQPQANPTVVTNNTDTTLPTFPKTVDFAVTWAGGTIQFDKRGSMQPTATPLGGTICIFTDFANNITHVNTTDGLSDFDPDYDCIVISRTRITMGKITTQDTAGGVCETANCTIK